MTVGVMSNVSRQLDTGSDHVCPANYVMSPPFVVAYAIAGSVLVDFNSDPIGILYLLILKTNS